MWGSRLRNLRKSKKMTQAELAEKAGTSPGHISALEKDTYPNPTVKSVIPIAKALNVTVEELFGFKPRSRVNPIPLIGKAIASPQGAYYTDQDFPPGGANEYIEVKDDQAFALEVESDSMSPRIKPGDRIVVTPNKKITSNGLGVVKLKSGKVFLKRVEITETGASLKSDNPDYPTLMVLKKEIEWIYRVEAIIPK
jgi:phage repressor protein C with HTH and peptisase S24 domain